MKLSCSYCGQESQVQLQEGNLDIVFASHPEKFYWLKNKLMEKEDFELNEYYRNYVPNQYGFLLVVDMRNIEEDPNKQYDILTGDAEVREKALIKMNKNRKCTLTQLKRIVARLEKVGLELEQNRGEENKNIYFIRISISETELMQAAQAMPLKKRLKPIAVPTLDGKIPPVVEGGFIQYSLTRGDAYQNHDINIWKTFTSILPLDQRDKSIPYKKDEDTSDDNLPCVYTELCPADRMPYLPGTNIKTLHDNYPGIFEKPDVRDATPDSLFTDEERLTIILWKMEQVAGFDVEINDKTGKGKIEFWLQEESSEDSGGGGTPNTSAPCCFSLFSSELDKPSAGTIGWQNVPVGLLFFEALTPTHDPIRRDALLANWALAPFKLCNPWYNWLKIPFICCCCASPWSQLRQPIQEIREYFGVKIAMYFLFIGHLLTWMWSPAIFGVGIMLYDGIVSENKEFAWDTELAPYYSVFLIFWATFFLEFWKRKRFIHTINWGTSDYENEPHYRKDWLDQYEALEGTDDPDEVDVMRAVTLESKFCYLTPDYWGFGMRTKKFFSVFSILLSIVIVLITVIGVLVYRAVVIARRDTVGTYAAGFFNAVSIMVLGSIYKRIAAVLTQWENHRTEIEFQDSLIAKTFLFEFCNQYSSLFYIAFGKPFFGPQIAGLLGLDVVQICLADSDCTATNVCVDGNFERSCAACKDNDCMSELAVQLLMILLVKSVLYKILNLTVPIVKRWWTRRKALKLGFKDRAWYEVESQLSFYSDVTEEYKEIAIMYGYIVLFAAAFPLAPLFSMVTTAVELRSDAYKILNSRRPIPQKVADLGTWYTVFELLATISVLTNIALISFTSNKGLVSSYNTGSRWAFIVLMEHAVLAVMWMLKFVVPDKSAAALAMKYQIKSKIEYLHRTMRYEQYYRLFDDEPINKTVNTVSSIVDDGLSCLSKPEMVDLGLDQMLRQEELIDDENEDKLMRNTAMSPRSMRAVSRINEDELDGDSILCTIIPRGERVTAEERLRKLTHLRGIIGVNTDALTTDGVELIETSNV